MFFFNSAYLPVDNSQPKEITLVNGGAARHPKLSRIILYSTSMLVKNCIVYYTVYKILYVQTVYIHSWLSALCIE